MGKFSEDQLQYVAQAVAGHAAAPHDEYLNGENSRGRVRPNNA
jgi:hypothetical protein